MFYPASVMPRPPCRYPSGQLGGVVLTLGEDAGLEVQSSASSLMCGESERDEGSCIQSWVFPNLSLVTVRLRWCSPESGL